MTTNQTIKDLVNQKFDFISQKIDNLSNLKDLETKIGYRGISEEGGYGSSEGIGIYIADDEELAQNFVGNNGKIFKVTYVKPLNPLIVYNQRLPILHYDDDDIPLIFSESIKENDTEWIKLHKQSAKNIDLFNIDRWWDDSNLYKWIDELTKLIKQKGYDAVQITSGYEWTVLLYPNYIIDSKLIKVVCPECGSIISPYKELCPICKSKIE